MQHFNENILTYLLVLILKLSCMPLFVLCIYFCHINLNTSHYVGSVEKVIIANWNTLIYTIFSVNSGILIILLKIKIKNLIQINMLVGYNLKQLNKQNCLKTDIKVFQLRWPPLYIQRSLYGIIKQLISVLDHDFRVQAILYLKIVLNYLLTFVAQSR